MDVIAGKRVRSMDAREFSSWATSYEAITLDLGAGDGRFVRELAGRRPEIGVVGVDLCAANMAGAARLAGGNALFVVADALALPAELRQTAGRIVIQFPWGSLLRGLLTGDPGLAAGLRAAGRAGAALDITVNAGALAEAGWSMDAGHKRIASMLRGSGMMVTETATLGPAELRRCPSTWARRLAFGRDPRAMHVAARMAGDDRARVGALARRAQPSVRG